ARRRRAAPARARGHQRSDRDPHARGGAAEALGRQRALHPAVPRAALGRVRQRALHRLPRRRQPLRAAVAQPQPAGAAGADEDRAEMKYLAKKILLYLVAAWASLTLAFVIPRLMPGDPETAMLARFHGKLKPDAMASLSNSMGFTHGPLWDQYLTY